MSAAEIDTYLAGVPEPGRTTLARLRADLRDLLPDAEEGLSYAAPAFRVDGTALAGFSAAKRHLSYLPHSGTVTTTLAERLAGYRTSKGAVQFALDTPLPRDLVADLVAARRAEVSGR